MKQRFSQPHHRGPPTINALVDLSLIHPKSASIVNPHNPIWMPPRMSDETTAKPRQPINLHHRRFVHRSHRPDDFIPKFRSHNLIRIERYHPIMLGLILRKPFLKSKSPPIQVHKNTIRKLASNGQRIVGAPRINNHDFRNPPK
jgi:hypothetical protein